MSKVPFVDPRQRYKNKKKAKSFQSPKPLVVIDTSECISTTTEGQRSAPSSPQSTMKFRSRSTADAQYLLHNAVMTEDISMLERLLDEYVREEKKINIDNMSTAGMTALHQASLIGNVNCVQLLVEAGANLYAKSKEKLSALQLAVNNGNFEVAEYLLSKGAQQDDIKEGVQHRKTSCI